ncbi:MAG: hypothetical protein GTN40_03480 [Candidatus Aenigmarchaeota archaeon]|nr:hypothetical protein [Candidatus Aenigmarchaeota archaeon]
MAEAKIQQIYALVGEHAPKIFPLEIVNDVKEACKFDIENYFELNPNSRKSAESLAGGSLYIYYILNHRYFQYAKKPTQKRLAKIFGCSESAIRSGFKALHRTFYDMFDFMLENEIQV